MSDLKLLQEAVSEALDDADSDDGAMKEDGEKMDKLLDDLDGLVDEISTSTRKVGITMIFSAACKNCPSLTLARLAITDRRLTRMAASWLSFGRDSELCSSSLVIETC